MAEHVHNTSRRRFLGHAAGATFAAGAGGVVVTETHANLHAALDRVTAWAAALEAQKGASDHEWDEWMKFGAATNRRIEALPLTPENARIRARALLTIYDGDISEFDDGDSSTDMRLARQIIETFI